MLTPHVVNMNRINFIAEYCDRWCERCPFTMRCSAFALSAALAMCDDHEEAFELALGRPRSPRGTEQKPPAWMADLLNADPAGFDAEEMDRQYEETRRRIRRTPLMMLADDFSSTAATWLHASRDALLALGAESPAGAAVSEACAVASNDRLLVASKIKRALIGHDEFAHGHDFGDLDDDPLQSDWNGSAKIALIIVTRGEAAWTILAQATRDDGAARLAMQLADIKVELLRTFPDAEKFVRPGFDGTSVAPA
jgi:hypothetical protein